MTYTYDVANRLIAAGAQTYVWDAAGNLITDGAITYTYDSAQRLIGLQSTGNTSSYVYNGLGDRVQQSVNGATTNYALDLNTGLTQVLADNGTVYLYGADRLGEQQVGGWQYHHADGLGSLRALTNGSATVTLSKRYAPYGDVLDMAGTGTSVFGFTGEHQNEGLVYLRARYYASGLGRFVSRDTWQGEYNRGLSLNRWVYVEANPTNWVDPGGNVPCKYLPPDDQLSLGCSKQSALPPNTLGYNEKQPPPGITFVGRNLNPVPDLAADRNGAQIITLYNTYFETGLRSTGLCGPVSVAAIVGKGANEVAFDFSDNAEAIDAYRWVRQDGTDLPADAKKVLDENGKVIGFQQPGNAELIQAALIVDINPNITSATELRNLINLKYGRFRAASFTYDVGNFYSQVRPIVARGASIITNNLVDGHSGRLYNSGSQGNFNSRSGEAVEHWIVLTGVSAQWNRPWRGNTSDSFGFSPWKWVRVYNPFDNGTEYYWWPDLRMNISDRRNGVSVNPSNGRAADR